MYYIYISIPEFLSPYDSPENSDHKRDENISPESLNRKHDRKYSGPENRNSKTQSMPLSAFPLDFLKKQMGNYGPQNTRVISFRKCCVNGQCLDILPDEECGDAKFMVSVTYVEYTNYSTYYF
jgi:hypothetical protein